jgi:hypothetical protein
VHRQRIAAAAKNCSRESPAERLKYRDIWTLQRVVAASFKVSSKDWNWAMCAIQGLEEVWYLVVGSDPFYNSMQRI